MTVVAAVDIGTNSIGLLVADARDGGLERLHREVRVTRLGKGVDRLGNLAPDAVARTLGVLGDYGNTIAAWHADVISAVATSAVRDAANRDSFLAAAGEALGAVPVVLSGAREAELSWQGATAMLSEPGPYVVLDVGGGSTEVVVAGRATSVDIGSVRLTERCLPDHPASVEQVAAARAEVTTLFEQARIGPQAGLVVGVGGTITSLAALHLPEYGGAAVQERVMGRGELDRLVTDLAALSVEETAAIPSLDPGRAEVILGGAVVVSVAVELLGAESVTAVETNIMEGIALDAAGGLEEER